MTSFVDDHIDRIILLTQKNIDDIASAVDTLTTAQADIGAVEADVTTLQSTVTAHTAALSWTAVSTFKNSWVNYGSGSANAQYCKDSHGFVHIIGRIKDGTITAAAFTLPTGYRPAETRAFVCSSVGAYGQINIDANGDVTPQVGNNSSFHIVADFYVG